MVEPPWVADDDPSLTVVVWRRADQLASAFSASASEAGGSFGSGAECVLQASRGRAEATADPLGYGSLFVWKESGVAAISTRIETLAQLATGLGHQIHKSYAAAEGLTHIGFVMPGVTGYDEISGVDPDDSATIEYGRLELSPNPDAIQWDGSAAKPELDDLVEGAATALQESVEKAVGGPADVVVDLTAGYDSHLILGALVRAGIAQDLDFQTIGGERIHDATYASARAAQLGLRHRWGFPYETSSADLWTRFVDNARLTNGLNNPKDGLREDLGRLSQTRISGLYGELVRGWRTGVSRTVPAIGRVDRIARAFGAGKAALLRTDREGSISQALTAEIIDEGAPERSAWHSTHRFYARARLRSRAMRLDDVVPESRRYPLYTKELVEFGIAAMRHYPDAPFDDLLLQRLEPLLTEPPPTKHDGPADIARSTSPGGSKPESLMRGGIAGQRDERRDVFGRIADTNSDAWEVVDRAAFRDAVQGYAELTQPQLSLLHGAANSVLWMSGLVESES